MERKRMQKCSTSVGLLKRAVSSQTIGRTIFLASYSINIKRKPKNNSMQDIQMVCLLNRGRK